MDNKNVSFLNRSKISCIDELDVRLVKLQGILAALMCSDETLEKSQLNAVVLTASDLVDECVYINEFSGIFHP